MVPKHLRKSNESLGGDQESLMASYIELQGRIKNDKSVLRQPIDTGVRGVRDLMKAVVGGTQELQELLLNECTIIYECKICRNLFRSLANFISHKRIYCIKNFSYFSGATDKQEVRELFQQSDAASDTEMINCNKDVNLRETKVWLTNNRIVPNNIKTEKNNCLKPTRRIKFSPVKITGKCDIAKIADGLSDRARRESLKACDDEQDSTFYSDIAERVMMRRCKLKKISPEVENLSNSCSARDSVQLEVIDRLVPCNEAVLQENGKFRVTPQGMQLGNMESFQDFKCSLCETHFITQQALSSHVQIHHKERICYPCPICRTFFPSPSSTYRHLSKDHHKTEQQIRRLRPKVLTKARKRKLVDGSSKLEEGSNAKSQRLNENSEGVLRCTRCGKLFNRQAVLRVHVTTCKEGTRDAVPPPTALPLPPLPSLPPPPFRPPLILPQDLSTCKPEQRKSGILVRRDYGKKLNCDAKTFPLTATTNAAKISHPCKRVNKWRTVLKKLQNRTGLNEVSEK